MTKRLLSRCRPTTYFHFSNDKYTTYSLLNILYQIPVQVTLIESLDLFEGPKGTPFLNMNKIESSHWQL